jgi:quinoprotein glucose dehydrogenase
LELAVTFLRDGDPDERRAALHALVKISAPEAVDVLAMQLDQQIAGLLPPEVGLDLALAAEAKKSPKLDERLAELRAGRKTDAWMGEYADSLHGGDEKRGRKLFREKSELACLRCHTIAEKEGGEVGPDLVGVGKRLDRRTLLESLVEPNKTIADGFKSTILFLKDESHLEGRVLSEDAAKLVLIDADAKKHEIEVKEIDERREGLSSMPADLTKHLSREEMRDLIEFLSRL